MGTYPYTGLKATREKRDDAREQLARGIDPSEVRRAEKASRSEGSKNSLEVVARETLLAERLGFDDVVIEAQLAHTVKDTLRRACNRTEFVERRRAMMQAWADYPDTLRTGEDHTSTKKRRNFKPAQPPTIRASQ